MPVIASCNLWAAVRSLSAASAGRKLIVPSSLNKNVGLAAFIKQICSTAVRLISRTGRPVPETLAVLASGYLEEHQLSQRTALRPAAMVLQQRQAL